MASGDLTDAKTKDMLGSRQFAEEWTSYYSVLKDTQVMNKTVWLDIRGNHDNFNIPKLHAPEDMFVRNSAQGSTHKRSYLHQIKKGSETYSFIAVDACLNPGPKRPFNFIGLLSVNDTEELINLAEKSRELGKKNIPLAKSLFNISSFLQEGITQFGLVIIPPLPFYILVPLVFVR